MAVPVLREYKIIRSHADGPRSVVWTAVTSDQQVYGSLIIDSASSEIQWIGTDVRYRRRGIATALFAAARADGYNPQHSPHRTPEGELWARAVGGSLPSNRMFAKA